MSSVYKTICLSAALVLVVAAGAIAGDAQLKVGNSVEVEGLTITFEAVSSDGRCPTGLYCFWEGDAACNLMAQAENMESKRLVLHTSSFYGREVVYNGWTIRMVKLDPYPVFERPPAPDSYVVTLLVTHASLLGTEESTWSRIKALYR